MATIPQAASEPSGDNTGSMVSGGHCRAWPKVVRRSGSRSDHCAPAGSPAARTAGSSSPLRQVTVSTRCRSIAARHSSSVIASTSAMLLASPIAVASRASSRSRSAAARSTVTSRMVPT
jgi:hypothetical protein